MLCSPKLFALIVLYNQSLDESTSWNTLSSYADERIVWGVYNNGPHSQNIPEFVHYHENLSNVGLAIAYKWGVEEALKEGATHILLLDQDTTFPEYFLTQILHHLAKENIDCLLPTVISQKGYKLSPNRWFLSRGWQFRKNAIPHSYSFIGSGTTISLHLLSAIWDDGIEQLFLEHIDHYLSYKMRKRGIIPSILPLTIRQNYSAESLDRKSVIPRHSIWMKDVITFSKLTHCRAIMRFWIFYISIKRMIQYRDPFLFVPSRDEK